MFGKCESIYLIFSLTQKKQTLLKYGEFDCWKLECPPITCQNPLPLLPGECCPRCPGDMCGLGNSTESCLYEKLPYSSGQSSSSSYEHSSKNCASCTCKVSS